MELGPTFCFFSQCNFFGTFQHCLSLPKLHNLRLKRNQKEVPLKQEALHCSAGIWGVEICLILLISPQTSILAQLSHLNS